MIELLILSEKRIVEIFAVGAQNLLIDSFFVANLRLSLSKLDIGSHQV